MANNKSRLKGQKWNAVRMGAEATMEWPQLSDVDRQPYINLYLRDKERYDREKLALKSGSFNFNTYNLQLIIDASLISDDEGIELVVAKEPGRYIKENRSAEKKHLCPFCLFEIVSAICKRHFENIHWPPQDFPEFYVGRFNMITR